MARIAWRFEDLVESTVLLMPINPNEGASPNYQKQLTKSRTTAPGVEGRPLIFEGADQIVQFNFSGVILTEAHYNFLYNAWAKRHPVQLTDDLGRVFNIYFETFEPKRELSRTYPWKHKYQVSTVVIDYA